MVEARKFTFQYSRLEDRLKMLINYDSVSSRVDFFITRAMLFRLIPIIEQILIKLSTARQERSAPVADRHLHVNAQEHCQQETKTDKTALTLLEQHETLLLEKVDFTWHKQTKRVEVSFYAQGKLQCHALLDGEHFAAVMHGMIRAVPHTSWGMAPNILQI